MIAPDTNGTRDGFQGTWFTGVFDGNGHVIRKLKVTGGDYLGLFGFFGWDARVSNLGLEAVVVSGTGDYVGGLVGRNGHGSIAASHSSGSVSGTSSVSGLVGKKDDGTANSSFWDIQTSGQTKSAGGTGKTTAQMHAVKTFLAAGWDFVGETANGADDTWWIDEGKDYPRLWWELEEGAKSSP